MLAAAARFKSWTPSPPRGRNKRGTTETRILYLPMAGSRASSLNNEPARAQATDLRRSWGPPHPHPLPAQVPAEVGFIQLRPLKDRNSGKPEFAGERERTELAA